MINKATVVLSALGPFGSQSNCVSQRLHGSPLRSLCASREPLMSPFKCHKDARRHISAKRDQVHDFLAIPNDVILLLCSSNTPGLFGWSHLGNFKKLWKTVQCGNWRFLSYLWG